MTVFAFAAAVWSTSAWAQTSPYPSPYRAHPGGVPAAIADQHRDANDRLRAQAESNAALARRQQTETRQRLLEIEAAREANASPALPNRANHDLGHEHPLQDPAAERQETRQGLSQIDDWLDRPN